MSDRLALAGLGDAFAFVTTDDGGVNVYPADRLSPTFGLDGPLASGRSTARRSTGRRNCGRRRGMAGELSPRMLAGAAAFVTPDNCQDAADGLREQAGLTDVPGMLLVFSWDAAPAPAGPPAACCPAAAGWPSAGARRPTTARRPVAAQRGGTLRASPPRGSAQRTQPALPTAVNASPPLVDAPPPADSFYGSAPAASRPRLSMAAPDEHSYRLTCPAATHPSNRRPAATFAARNPAATAAQHPGRLASRRRGAMPPAVLAARPRPD